MMGFLFPWQHSFLKTVFLQPFKLKMVLLAMNPSFFVLKTLQYEKGILYKKYHDCRTPTFSR
jgi:hypothetical protein